MKILITGSYGFVGTNLIEAFSGEHEIIRWDVRSHEALPEVDVVIHLAAIVHDTKNSASKEEYFYVNTELTKIIYTKFANSTARIFIYFSSIKAVENDTPYAKSKFAAEKFINNYYRSNPSFLKRTYILRPCLIHGKGVKANFRSLYNYVKSGYPWPFASFENKRSYTSIGNVIFVVRELLKKDIKSQTFNVCDDEPISTNTIVRLICESTGKKCRMLQIPKCIIYNVARMGDWLHLPLNMERLEKLSGDFVVDNKDLKEALGIKEMPISAFDGLKSTMSVM